MVGSTGQRFFLLPVACPNSSLSTLFRTKSDWQSVTPTPEPCSYSRRWMVGTAGPRSGISCTRWCKMASFAFSGNSFHPQGCKPTTVKKNEGGPIHYTYYHCYLLWLSCGCLIVLFAACSPTVTPGTGVTASATPKLAVQTSCPAAGKGGLQCCSLVR